MPGSASPTALDRLRGFPLLSAIEGRRSRRFGFGMRIPRGPLAYHSRHAPLRLSQTEEALVIAAVSGTTGWLFLHPFSPHGRPDLPAYAAAAGGRTFPSSGGFHTTEVFYTNDDGIYFVSTRDRGPSERRQPSDDNPVVDARRLSEQRLIIPEDPFIAPHNRWCANQPGTTLIMPIADVAQQLIALIGATVQRGMAVHDDITGRPFDGLDEFTELLDARTSVPLSVIEQEALWSCATELGIACYAGSLVLQALGLGSWMFGGIDSLAIMGVARNQERGGLGFRADDRADWSVPNPIGLPGVFEGYCPPNFGSMSEAVQAFSRRRFRPGGPFNRETPGPWRATKEVRGAVGPDSQSFLACVSRIAETIYERFDRFPATAPSVLMTTYLQAHHLDLDYYDRFFEPGAYLDTHRAHMADWHGEEGK